MATVVPFRRRVTHEDVMSIERCAEAAAMLGYNRDLLSEREAGALYAVLNLGCGRRRWCDDEERAVWDQLSEAAAKLLDWKMHGPS